MGKFKYNFIYSILIGAISLNSCSCRGVLNNEIIDSKCMESSLDINDEKLTSLIVNNWDEFSSKYVFEKYLDGNGKKYQGLTINNDIMFQAINYGLLKVVDFNSDGIKTYKMGSYSETNHSNSCASIIIDNIIHLYVTNGNTGSMMMCSVEKFVNDKFYNIQNIYLNQDDFEDYNYVKNWGWPCWLLSEDPNFIYTFSARFKTNGSMRKYDDDNNYILTKFYRPSLLEEEIVLSGQDVIEQVLFPYEVEYTQGGCLSNDCLCYTFGKNTTEFPNKIMFLDIKKNILLGIIDVSDIYSHEIESCCFYGDRLYLQYEDGSVYYIFLKE